MATRTGRKEQSHDRIVEAAARALRRNGYAGVGVAEVMKEAGLTHGGFYSHFASRDAMIAEAVEHASHDSITRVSLRIAARRARGVRPLRALVESYLADENLLQIECGCPVAALASEMPRQQDLVAEASRGRVLALIAGVGSSLPTSADPSAAGVLAATLVGSLQLARTLGDNIQGRALLAASIHSLVEQYDPEDSTPLAA